MVSLKSARVWKVAAYSGAQTMTMSTPLPSMLGTLRGSKGPSSWRTALGGAKPRTASGFALLATSRRSPRARSSARWRRGTRAPGSGAVSTTTRADSRRSSSGAPFSIR